MMLETKVRQIKEEHREELLGQGKKQSKKKKNFLYKIPSTLDF